MSRNSNFHKSRVVKNDEFYTKLTDINNELKHYKGYFKDKTVFCNCDDPSTRNGGKGSNFHTYFIQNFKHLGLKKLITTHYVENGVSYKNEVTKADFDNGRFGLTEDIKLNGDGDFRSDECIELLKEADIVVTNPPFSLFREYVAQLMEYNKKFLIIGLQAAVIYKDISPLVVDGKLWVGCSNPKQFDQPDGSVKSFGNIGWFTNLEHNKRNEELISFRQYKEDEYVKYDNYDAIHISKIVEIPKDYFGAMGVPVTFLSKHNPNQFEIIKFRKGNDNKDLKINGKSPYTRMLIKRK